MGVCVNCVHFRRCRPASQLLAAAAGNTTAEEVASALTKIVEDESRQREAEATYKGQAATDGHELWSYRPVMSDYCALREADGVYVIAEVKNLGGRCEPPDYDAGPAERHACADCAHRGAAQGEADDRALQMRCTNMVVQATWSRASTQTAEGLLNSARKSAAGRRAFEIASAYMAKGLLASRPAYLDHCMHYSTKDDFAVCMLLNPHNRCPDWTPVAPLNTPAS